LPIARIIYTINFEVCGAQSESIPEELLSVPTTESYITSLKESNPTAFNIFQNLNATTSRGIYTKQGESPLAPTLVPTHAASASFPRFAYWRVKRNEVRYGLFNHVRCALGNFQFEESLYIFVKGGFVRYLLLPYR
jgi:hypothetical protein